MKVDDLAPKWLPAFEKSTKIYRGSLHGSQLSSILDLKMAGKIQNWSDQIIKSSNHDQVARSHLDLHKLHHELTLHLRRVLVELL